MSPATPPGIPYRGLAISMVLLVVLLSPPSDLLARSGAFADTQGEALSGSAEPVEFTAAMDRDPATALPHELGPWSWAGDPQWPDFGAVLAYDSLFVREYGRPGFFFPAQLMIISARQAQAFHRPEICFATQAGVPTVLSPTTLDDSLPVGRLIIEFPEGGERGSISLLVYSVYVVERRAAAADRTTWIRLMMPGVDVPNWTQLDPYMMDLMGRIIPNLLAARDESRTTWSWIVSSWGLGAGVVAAAAVVVPAAVDLAGGRRKQRRP